MNQAKIVSPFRPTMVAAVNFTEWHNPTQHTVKLEFFVGDGQPNVKVEIEPEGHALLPAEWDRAVQTVRDGRIIGGKAPQLVRVGERPLPVHEAIARAAVLGTRERAAEAATGTSGGAAHLDAAAAVAGDVKALEQRMEARLRALEGARDEATAQMHLAKAEAAKAQEEAERARAEAEEVRARAEAEARRAQKAHAEAEELRAKLESLQAQAERKKPGH